MGIRNWAIELGIWGKEEVKDEKVLDIFEYLNELEHSSDWDLVKSEENLSLKKRSGSKYSSDFLTSRLEFSFEYSVPLKQLLDHLNDQELRPKWDKNFVVFENIESKEYQEYILYSAFKVITYKTEYLEKKVLLLHKNRVYIIVYSLQDSRKPEGSVNRAHTFFSVMVVYEHNGKTGLLVYNQTDPNSFLAKMATSVAITKLSDWALKLKKQIDLVCKVG